jgi:type I restriction enzyme M protein
LEPEPWSGNIVRLLRGEKVETEAGSGPRMSEGVAPGQAHDAEEFKETLEALQEELETLNAEAAQLQSRITENVTELLEA